MASYLLKLFQVARVHSESFTVEAKDEAEAKARAAAIAAEKGLKKDFDFEIVDLSQIAKAEEEAKQAANPTEPEER